MPKKDHHLVEINRPEKPQADTIPQVDRFKELARELGCDEDEAAFDAALKRIAEAKPGPKHDPKKRGRATDAHQRSSK